MASPVRSALRTLPAGGTAAPPSATGPATSTGRAGGVRRWVRGPDDDPRWARPALGVLLLGTALLYLWSLGASGWANAFYSAAAQAGSQSWKAWFFGASDAPGLIMVDKPPASLWVMGLSARLFGVDAWAILVPQALMGVATVAFLHAAVRRWAGPAAGLVAGLVLALTPVATLMFRFNNPDALLVLLLVVASWAVVRAVDAPTPRRATRWLLLAAALVGTGFLTKSLQAYLVLPALTLVWLLAGPGRWRGRLVALVPTAVMLVVASGWWIAVVDLWPAADRPYVGGSQTDSALELVLGYNGLGRVTGDETGSVGGGGGGGGGGAMTGGGGRSTGSVLQLFTGEMSTQVAWLLPAALLLGLALLVWTRRAPRSDRTRAATLMWGGSLVVTAAVFTLSQGIIHSYYSIALAPGIAALVGLGVGALARHGGRAAWAVLATTTALTAVWCWYLLRETPTFLPWLRAVVLVGGLLVAAALLVAGLLRGGAVTRRLLVGLVAASVVLGVAAPAAYAVQTASTTHSGALPTAGPGAGGPGGTGGPGGAGGPGGGGPGGAGGSGTGAAPQGGPGAPGGGAGGARGGPPGAAPGTGGGGGRGGGGGGGMMTLLEASRPSARVTSLLVAGAPGHTWVAAAVGSNAAAGYQLASGAPVMALGGFNGTDPAPTLARFQGYVATGAVHYFVGGASSASISTTDSGGSDDAAQIAAWVAAHYAPVDAGGTTVYDLTAPVR